MSNLQQLNAVNQRVWATLGGVHPSRSPEFLSLGKFGDDPSITIGESTKVSAPDPNNFQRDIQVGEMAGETERASLSISSRYTTNKSIMLDWKNRRCRVDIYALSGKCGNPQDFTEGGEKWTYFADGQISGHSFENFGAFGLDENNPTNDMVDMTAEDYWEFLYMRQDQIGSTVTVREIYTVDVYAGKDCDTCPDTCSKVLMTMAGASATPGTVPSLIYSTDGGESFAAQNITTLFSNESIADSAIIGGCLVLISNTSNSIHWTDVEEVYTLANVWTEVTKGFVAAKSPNAMSSADVRHTWIVGDGGYVYFAKNFKIEVEVQDAGVATTQNLNAVHAFDKNNVLAVGNSNAVIYTSNGGTIWENVTGPSIGVNMGACWMWDAKTWLVGEGAGGSGKLWLTVDAGITWSEIGLPASYVRIDDIEFVSEAEGYMTVRSGGSGYVLRTITAGNEWVVLPQGKKGTPVTNSYLRHIRGCTKFANTVYAVGLNVAAGIALKMAG